MKMVEKDQTFNLVQIERTYPLYLILYHYYSEKALHWSIEDWQKVIEILLDYNDHFYNRNIEEGLTLLSELDSHDKEEFMFDYNRLFIGPDRLLAPPYESSYRSSERTLMQNETLNVRKFYQKIGLQVKEKNIIPDDHLSFELELICYLLFMAIENKETSYLKEYEEFFENHLSVWVNDHCRDILNNTSYFVCAAMAKILLGVVEMEKTLIQARKGE